ncbi:MAG: hypothetical protein JWO52_661 [Gammaproteobacteria bacterium]|jgi:hypothetical protein|nr:hypothetical protein [Gammaproteobacteria bacterium]
MLRAKCTRAGWEVRAIALSLPCKMTRGGAGVLARGHLTGRRRRTESLRLGSLACGARAAAGARQFAQAVTWPRVFNQHERTLEQDFPSRQSLINHLPPPSGKPIAVAILSRFFSTFPGFVQRPTCCINPFTSAVGASSNSVRMWGCRSWGTFPVRSARKSSRSVSTVLKLTLAAVLARRRKSDGWGCVA